MILRKKSKTVMLEWTLDSELKTLEESDKIEKFAGTGLYKDQTHTIAFLNKESQDLRNEIIQKSMHIKHLESEITELKSHNVTL
jgi:chaperonin cofactor prefoldin